MAAVAAGAWAGAVVGAGAWVGAGIAVGAGVAALPQALKNMEATNTMAIRV